ncbi:hypothetical protein JL722_6980 [Aureococcus anophagefferens]|nr:hypothetical protein JL722_6980 [Aureococcus anophagefferens]
MVLLAISEAVRLGALDEADARDVLDATRYEREAFAAGHDDDNMKISFVRGDYDGLADDETRGSLTGKSVGDHLSITAGLLTPLVWNDAALSIDRAKSVVFDLQFVDDATLGGRDDLGFLTSTPNGLSFYRQVTKYRTQRNSGGSTESDGWNHPDRFRDAHKVCWEDDVAMGTLTAAMLVEYHLETLDDAERGRLGDVSPGSREATTTLGWGVYGLALMRRTLAALGRDDDAAAAAGVVAHHLETIVGWQGAEGLWWQNPNGDVDGLSGAPSDDGDVNFVETSGSALILAAMGEMAAVGALPATAAGAFDDGIRGLLAYVDGDGDIPNCGKGTSIGAEASYYYSRGVDDPDGCGKAGLCCWRSRTRPPGRRPRRRRADAAPDAAPDDVRAERRADDARAEPAPTTRPTPRPTTICRAPRRRPRSPTAPLVATATARRRHGLLVTYYGHVPHI